MRMVEQGLDRLLEAAAAGRRSPLYRWMAVNHDRFLETLAVAGRPNWKALAVEFGEMGLLVKVAENDAAGLAKLGERARKTWLLVRDARKARGLDRAPKARPADFSNSGSFVAGAAEVEERPADVRDALSGGFKFKTVKGNDA